jgi:hypothetical protein
MARKGESHPVLSIQKNMKTIRLPASLASDLDWTEYKAEGEILWELDFDFQFNDAAFKSYILAVEQFAKEFPGASVVLYRGSLDIVKKIPAENEVDAATIFGDFLHRLASFLPDDAKPYCFFEGPHSFSPGKAAQLMSKERFWHLHLHENTSRIGVLLPPDELCSPEVLAHLEAFETARIIPEKRLNEMWDGLDQLWVIEEGLSSQGLRQVKGFEAAGGEIKFLNCRS